jgi:hypothetical protein
MAITRRRADHGLLTTVSANNEELDMLVSILQHTPPWIWALLVVLIAVGVSQSVERRRTLPGAAGLPIALTALSLYGAVSVAPQAAVALIAWAIGAAAALALCHVARLWAGIRWSASDRRLVVAGSWMPMVLILGLFVTKFGVAVTLALHPEVVHESRFSLLLPLVYGLFSGMFAARSVAMWRAWRAHGDSMQAGSVAASNSP